MAKSSRTQIRRKMIYDSHQLKKPLSDYIESIFYYKGFMPDHSIERLVPTGHVFIIFELNGLEYHTFDKDTLKPNGNFRNVWVSGMHKDYLSISAHQDSEMLVIQFKTIGAYPFIKTPIYSLNNKVLNAPEVFGDDILELREQILESENAQIKFKCVENWLMQIFDSSKIPKRDILDVYLQLKTKQYTECSQIIASYPKTQKHLISQFKTYFGLTPKVFHRIFRFNEILKNIKDKHNLLWSDIAYEFGYADQSHFIKEFKQFSGFNPQEFISYDYHKGDEMNFFPLDKKG